jgi:hypothetical protein
MVPIIRKPEKYNSTDVMLNDVINDEIDIIKDGQ